MSRNIIKIIIITTTQCITALPLGTSQTAQPPPSYSAAKTATAATFRGRKLRPGGGLNVVIIILIYIKFNFSLYI